jgi:nucleotide-binding universal stress UspA family protein
MYSKILVATDGSELSVRALRTAAYLAKAEKSAVVVVTVTSSMMSVGYSAIGDAAVEMIAVEAEAATDHAKALLEAARAVLDSEGVDADYVHVRDHEPADGIIKTATDTGPDLIIMGSHGRRGIQRLLLGSEASHVLTLSKVPVLIVK